jgi:hypothetical protein
VLRNNFWGGNGAKSSKIDFFKLLAGGSKMFENICSKLLGGGWGGGLNKIKA